MEQTGLSGWSAIENYLQKHDLGVVQDYADDIDTLLVFVSLLDYAAPCLLMFFGRLDSSPLY